MKDSPRARATRRVVARPETEIQPRNHGPLSVGRRREKDSGRPKSLNECNLVAPGEGKTGPGPAFLKPEDSSNILGEKIAFPFTIKDIYIRYKKKEGTMIIRNRRVHPRVRLEGTE